MIKVLTIFHGTPARGDVAGRALLGEQLLAEFADVRVLVTVFTSLLLKLLPLINADGQPNNRFGFSIFGQMALFALHLFVFAVNHKARMNIVVEIFNIFPLRIGMARRA